jgi:membrane-associated phospholipid phosphatase
VAVGALDDDPADEPLWGSALADRVEEPVTAAVRHPWLRRRRPVFFGHSRGHQRTDGSPGGEVNTAAEAPARDEAPPRSARVARFFTEVLAPWVIVLTLPFPVAWYSTTSVASAVLWALVGGVCGSLVPMAFILRAVRKGNLTDHHVGVREQRFGPLVVCIGSVVAGIGLLAVTGAPDEVVALSVAEFAGLAATLPITFWWKVSVHSMVAAGAAAILTVIFGPLLLVMAVPVAAVGWSRVRLGDHTGAQVIAGSLIGVAVAGPVFMLMPEL